MNHNQELQNYLRSLESDTRFSGMNDEGEISIGYDGANDFSRADGGYGMVATSQPYVLSIANSSSAVTQTAILFGYTDYSVATNYGSQNAITITNTQGGTYARLLVQSQAQPFNISKWKFISTNSTQLNQTVTISHVNADGSTYSVPLTLAVEQSMFSQNTTVLDVERNLFIDANTYLSIPILASATLQVVMYPTEIANVGRPIIGGSIVRGFQAPSVLSNSGNNVVIKTTAPVRGMLNR